MKTTLDIPEKELKDVIRFTGAKTKREAIVTAVADFNRRARLAKLASKLGTFKNFISSQDLKKLRATN